MMEQRLCRLMKKTENMTSREKQFHMVIVRILLCKNAIIFIRSLGNEN